MSAGYWVLWAIFTVVNAVVWILSAINLRQARALFDRTEERLP